MTCTESRELHSAFLDAELTPAERAQVEAHLAGCPECSGELERLARMLGLLHALPAARAPVGFVDRVLDAVRPVPWYARLARRLLLPWKVKLPLEAAAVLIVALGAVYVFQRTPELQQATRYEAPASGPAPTPAPAPGPAPAPSAPPPSALPPASAPARSAAPPPVSKSAPAQEPAAPPAVATPTPPPVSRSAEAPKLESTMKERDANAMKDASPPAPAAPAPAPAEEERARDKKAVERREQLSARQDAQPAPAPDSQRLGAAAPAARQFVAPDVSGRLTVADPAAAEVALAALRGRLRIPEAFRRDAGEGKVVIEVVVPREAYGDFTRGLDEIGAWTTDREPPAASPQIRVQILLAS